MNIYKQIWKEFWFPLILSILWTLYNIFGGENRGEWPVQKIVNTFGPTFFLLSWVTGQFFRVKKQTKVEKSFGSMEVRFKELMDKLEAKAEETIAHISGGNSFPWVQVGEIGPLNTRGLIVLNQGDYPLYDLNVRVVNLQQLAQASKSLSFISAASIGERVHVGNIIPSECRVVVTIDVRNVSELSFNIFFTARNGFFTQFLRLKKINGSWTSAIKVTNKDDAILLEDVDELFPRDASGNVSW